MGGGDAADMLVTEGRAGTNNTRTGVRRFKFISPGFLGTVGTPLITGRDLTWTDTYEKRAVTLVSENLARAEWGSPAEALGKRLRGSSNRDDWREIVGVVGDVRDDGVTRPATEIVYFPLLVDRIFNAPTTVVRRGVTFVVRSSRTGTPGFLDEIRGAVWAANPDLPLADVRTLGDLYERSLARTSLTLVLLALAGAMALLLGVVGIYGVVAYIVSQSAREIGIRIALGATSAHVRRDILGRAAMVTGMGALVGMIGALATSHFFTALLFQVAPTDPIALGGACAILLTVGAVAAYLPARRATRIDPVEALRAD
jgi:ABC-type antimicrobial peptide transport system permease subunit